MVGIVGRLFSVLTAIAFGGIIRIQNSIVYYYAYNHDTHFFGGYMKKSSLLTKIMLSLVLVALVFALVACNGNKEPDKPDTPPDNTEKTLAEQVVEIIQGVNPILKVVNDTKSDGTLGADLSLSVKYDISGNSNDLALAVKANANATNPAAQISFKQKAQEWVNVTVNDGKVYLVQPLTAVNTANKTDGIQADIAALAPAVTDIMEMAMDVIDGMEIALPADLATSIGEMLSGDFASGITKLINIETTTSGYKVVLGSEIMEALQSLLPMMLKGTVTNLVGESLATKIMDAVVTFLGQKPELSIEINLKNNAISGLAIGYKLVTETGTDTASLNLDFSLSNERVSITNPTVGNNALNIGAVAELAQKDLKAEAEVYGVADFSEDLKNLVFATAKINGAESKGYFNGQTVYFDTNAVYEGLGQPAPDNTKYNVTIGNINKETYAKTNSSVVKMINEAAEKVNASYFAKKNAASNASYADDATAAPSKSLNQTVYEMLGGTLVLKKDGKSYEDVSEKDVMTKLNELIGDYIRFELDTTNNKDNYFNTVKNILTLFGQNDQWIIGYDLIKGTGATVDLSGLTKMDDFMTFANWINMENGKVKVPADMNGVYGIFNWDTTNYNGGVTLSKEGAQNDLLDAINVFVTPKKNADGTCDDVDAEFLAEFADYYVAALGYYMGEYDEATTNEIDAIDMKYAYAKFQYANGDITKEALNEAKKAHKNALKDYYTSANANKVFTKILGVSFDDNDRSYVAQLIEDGLYLHLGSEKNAGLNGYIEIKDSMEGTKSYAFVSGHINVVANDVNAKIAEWNVNTEDFATDLFTPEKVTAADEDAGYYAKIATVEGTNVKQVIKNVEGDNETYEYAKLVVEGETQYNDRYTALEDLFESLGGALMSYFGIN